MKINRRHLAALGAAAGIAASFPAAAQNADQRAVAEAVEKLTRAMLNPDRAALTALAHDALSYGHSAGRIETKAEFVDNLVGRNNPFGEINITDQTITMVGEDAIVRHNFTGNTTGGGRVTPVRIGILQVWTRHGGDWRLLARQAFVRPPA